MTSVRSCLLGFINVLRLPLHHNTSSGPTKSLLFPYHHAVTLVLALVSLLHAASFPCPVLSIHQSTYLLPHCYRHVAFCQTTTAHMKTVPAFHRLKLCPAMGVPTKPTSSSPSSSLEAAAAAADITSPLNRHSRPRARRSNLPTPLPMLKALKAVENQAGHDPRRLLKADPRVLEVVVHGVGHGHIDGDGRRGAGWCVGGGVGAVAGAVAGVVAGEAAQEVAEEVAGEVAGDGEKKSYGAVAGAVAGAIAGGEVAGCVGVVGVCEIGVSQCPRPCLPCSNVWLPLPTIFQGSLTLLTNHHHLVPPHKNQGGLSREAGVGKDFPAREGSEDGSLEEEEAACFWF